MKQHDFYVDYKKQFSSEKFFEEVCKNIFPTENSGYFFG